MFDILCNLSLFLDDYIDIINLRNYLIMGTDSSSTLNLELDKYIIDNYFKVRNIIVYEKYSSINLQKINYVLSIPKSDDLRSISDLFKKVNIKYFELINKSFPINRNNC